MFAFQFLEGLFQNPGPCKDFMQNGGKELILKIYRLSALPYDFASSAPSYSISHAFRIMTDIDSPAILNLMLQELDKCLDDCNDILNYHGTDSLLAQFIDIKGSCLLWLF